MSTLGAYLSQRGFVVDDRPTLGAEGRWDRVTKIMVHHTAGSCSQATERGEATFIRSVQAAQLMLGQSGTVWVCTRQQAGQNEPGRADHAGRGGPAFGIPEDQANPVTLGVEVQCSGEHSLNSHPGQYRVLLRLLAALCQRYRLTADDIIGHKEWAPDRKIDPRDNMDTIRSEVALILSPPKPILPPAPTDPQPTTIPEDQMFMYRTADKQKAIVVVDGKQIYAEPATANSILRPIAGPVPLYFQASIEFQARLKAAFGVVI